MDRRSVQVAVRVGALAFVVAWLFARTLQDAIPFWLPFAVLLAAEIEFLVRGWRERRADSPPVSTEELAGRRRPSGDDADLGWGELVDEGDRVVYIPPPPRPTRPGPRRLIPVALVVAAAALFVAAARIDRGESWNGLAPATRARAEALFSAEASRIAEAPVTVRCDDGYAYTGIGSDALGVAFIRSRLALLRPDICRRLVAVAFEGDGRERDDTGRAVLVLAHEAVHLSGERDEGVTECRALQEGVSLGQRIGLERAASAAMMAELHGRILGERSITRLSYRLPPSCRNGGSLDLRPDDPTFP